MNSQHLSIVVVATVLILAICRAETKDIPKIVETLFSSNTFATVGWVLLAVTVIIAILAIRFIMKRYETELERVCAERDKLQDHILRGGKND